MSYSPVFGDDLYISDDFFSSLLNKSNEKYFNYKSNDVDNIYKLTGQNKTVTF